MRLKIIDIDGEQSHYFDSQGLTLAEVLGSFADSVEAISINGQFETDWRDFVPQDSDKIDLFPQPGTFAGFISFLGSLLASLALSFLSSLFAPKPKQPKAPQPATAVPGITNTITPGMSKLMVFGRRRIFPGVIGSQADILPDRRRMSFRVLYYCGIGPISSLSEVQLDEVPQTDMPDTFANARLGTDPQTILPGWENSHQIYPDIRTIKRGETFDTAGKPIFNRQKSLQVDRLTIFLHFASGHFGTRKKGSKPGSIHDGHSTIQIRYKLTTEDASQYQNIRASIDAGPLQQSPFFMADQTQDGFFRKIQWEAPLRSAFDLEFTMLSVRKSQQSADPILLNVQETLFFSTSYDGSALLEVGGIGSEQLTSLENLKTSVIECGLIVETDIV